MLACAEQFLFQHTAAGCPFHCGIAGSRIQFFPYRFCCDAWTPIRTVPGFSLSSAVRTGFRPRWLVRRTTLPLSCFCSASRYTVRLLAECASALPFDHGAHHSLVPVIPMLPRAAYHHLLLPFYRTHQFLAVLLMVAVIWLRSVFLLIIGIDLYGPLYHDAD
jgi:hypothetical protein